MGSYTEVYEGGQFLNSEDAWLAGVNGAVPGLWMPGAPKAGTPPYYQVQIPGGEQSSAQVVDVGRKTCVPFKCYTDVVVVEEGVREQVLGVGGGADPHGTAERGLAGGRRAGQPAAAQLEGARGAQQGGPEAGSGCGGSGGDRLRWIRARRAPVTPLVHLEDVSKTFREGSIERPVLRRADLELHRGGMTSLVGTSGSGKSTLISLLAGLMLPDSGRVVDGDEITGLDDAARAELRARRVGIVLQSGNLIPFLTATQNVELAMEFGGGTTGRRRPSCSRGSDWASGSITCRDGCRAGKGSACRWPWRWRTIPTSCSPTRSPASSTR